ncbi:hypothetical protein [Pararhizobium haloflavum]|uniref:hypothetical protein n=1 Tax=Pararhizobium haloflavum TaxID=2037914 RepID=UPI000C18FAFD|nr:hypothetical protein [Pararhizobium haloflavum]
MTTTRITAAAAALFLLASPALAQSGGSTTALDNVPTPGNAISGTNSEMMMSEGAYGVFYEEDGTTMRSEEDAMTAYEGLSAEDQEMVNMACTDWEEERVGFLDSVTSTCKAVTGAGVNQ